MKTGDAMRSGEVRGEKKNLMLRDLLVRAALSLHNQMR